MTDETTEIDGKTLRRFRALKDFGYIFGKVKAGDLGGFIENEYNLSREGNCWIWHDAIFFGDAKIYNNAKVFDNSKFCYFANIYENASVYCNAEVYGNAIVYRALEVSESSIITTDEKQ
ncbi:hypothetical protein [Bartonella sp. AS69XJJH]